MSRCCDWKGELGIRGRNRRNLVKEGRGSRGMPVVGSRQFSSGLDVAPTRFKNTLRGLEGGRNGSRRGNKGKGARWAGFT